MFYFSVVLSVCVLIMPGSLSQVSIIYNLMSIISAFRRLRQEDYHGT